MKQDIEIFREGIFALNTRRFGTVAEIMIKKLYDYSWSKKRSFDLYNHEDDERIEVKFSRALRKHPEPIRENNVVDQCVLYAYLKNRSLNSDEVNVYSFDSNIQQIKCRNFDYLFYGLFFMDCIEIYGVYSEEIYNIPGYSDYQHAGNKGEGQFHLNNSSIEYHRNNYLQEKLTYPKLFKLLLSQE